MHKKSKRKFRLAHVHPRTGQFVAAGFPGAKRRRIHVARAAVVYRDKKSGRFKPPNQGGEKQQIGPTKAKRLFSRQIKRKTLGRKVTEVVYEIPFSLVRQGRRQQYEPDYSALTSGMQKELSIQRAEKDTRLHTAVCKVNVVFRESASNPEDIDTWVQIPVGRRVPVDEPGGVDDIYKALLKFFAQYEVWAVSQIQLSILRIPI